MQMFDLSCVSDSVIDTQLFHSFQQIVISEWLSA